MNPRVQVLDIWELTSPSPLSALVPWDAGATGPVIMGTQDSLLQGHGLLG